MEFDLRGLCPLLQVFDMPRSLAFYRDCLGFEIVQAAPPAAAGDDFGWCWLRRGSAEVMLNTAYDPEAIRPAAEEPGRVAAHDDTCLYIGCPDVDGVYRYLIDRGVRCDPPTDAPYGMKQLYLKDPDGFGLCFQWPVGA